MAQHLLTGQQGEETAVKYLQQSGYIILERNVRFKRDEIDIVAEDQKEKMVVFVEVKTRASHCEAYPIHSAVTWHKRKCLRRAINRWVNSKRYDGPGRIDVVCVSGTTIVEHIKDVGSDFS